VIIWRWIRTILLSMWAVESLLLRLGWLVLTLGWSKYWAVQAYRRELQKAGLPHAAVHELAAAYDLSLSDVVRLGWRRRRKHRK
jgi:hypothetical protein